jgi:hypothetical protein
MSRETRAEDCPPYRCAMSGPRFCVMAPQIDTFALRRSYRRRHNHVRTNPAKFGSRSPAA